MQAKQTDKPTVSPSQAGEFDRCQRRWGFKKLDGLSDDPGEGALTGGVMHKDLETYYRRSHASSNNRPTQGSVIGWGPPQTKREKKARRLANALINFYVTIPLPASVTIEGEFFVEFPRYYSHGFVDLQYRDVNTGLLTVHDHKSSSNPERWGLTAVTLPKDYQGIMYAHKAFIENPDESELLLRWGYVNSRGTPKPFAVEAVVSREFTMLAYETKIDPIANAIIDARESGLRAASLKPNFQACGDYKGCPFAHLCPREKRTLSVVMGTTKENEPVKASALLNKIKNRNKAAETVEEKPKEAAQEKPKSTASSKVLNLKDKIKKNQAAKEEQEPVAGTIEEDPPETGAQLVEGSGDQAATEPEKPKDAKNKLNVGARVNPPEGPDTGDEEALVEMSKRAETEGLDKESLRRIAEEEAAKNAGKAEALQGEEILARLKDVDVGVELPFSIKRANDGDEYVQKKTLEQLASQELITYYIAGQTAFVRIPDNRRRHAEVWVRFFLDECNRASSNPTESLESITAFADAALDEYRVRFG